MPVARHNARAPARLRPSVVVALLNLAIVTSVLPLCKRAFLILKIVELLMVIFSNA